MPPFLYRCPYTGDNVQAWVADDPEDDDLTYVQVTCLGCAQAHSTGYALAARGMDTRRLQHFLGHAAITNTVRYTAMSPAPFKNIWR
jgi:hypothetical protein